MDSGRTITAIVYLHISTLTIFGYNNIMPTVRIGQSKVAPHYPQNTAERRRQLAFISATASGEFFNENHEIYQDDYSWWSIDRLPSEDSDRRIRITADNFLDAINILQDYGLSEFTHLDQRNISANKNILKIIIIAFNTYAEIKHHFVEDAPRLSNNHIIGYHTDYILLKDDVPNTFNDVFEGRCMVTIDSNIVRTLLFDISKNDWASFWIKITELYERIFNRVNNAIEFPDHLKVKHERTKLEKEYISRKDEHDGIDKEELLNILENMILPEEAYSKILNILEKEEVLC
jgi:signal transduction histidine kinase